MTVSGQGCSSGDNSTSGKKENGTIPFSYCFLDKNPSAVAELDVLDAAGKPISHDGWTIAYVDSEERTVEDGSAENAIDGQTANFWHTEWKNASPNHPHQLVLDLGKSQTISGFRYVPRQSEGPGRIKAYRIYVGDNLVLPLGSIHD